MIDIVKRQALEVQDTPYGTVGVVHAGRDLKAWWIWKDREEIEPTWLVLDREDLLYVIQGQLRLEFRDDPRGSIVVAAGQSCVVPPDTPSRGYRYPREGAPCLFLAVSSADVREARLC